VPWEKKEVRGKKKVRAKKEVRAKKKEVKVDRGLTPQNLIISQEARQQQGKREDLSLLVTQAK
jgi:hypothetical protein